MEHQLESFNKDIFFELSSSTMSIMERYSNNNHPSKPFNLEPSSFLLSPLDSLSRLSDSINRLAVTISGSYPPTDSSRDAYLNSTMPVLNMCNAVSAQIECLTLRCLRLKFARHLLSSPTADHLRCARKALSEWQVLSNGTDHSDCGLASVQEVERTNVAVRRLSEAIDSGEISSEKLRIVAAEMENSTEELTGALDRLTAAVNKLFTVVMASRNVVLDSYKVGPKRCK